MKNIKVYQIIQVVAWGGDVEIEYTRLFKDKIDAEEVFKKLMKYEEEAWIQDYTEEEIEINTQTLYFDKYMKITHKETNNQVLITLKEYELEGVISK